MEYKNSTKIIREITGGLVTYYDEYNTCDLQDSINEQILALDPIKCANESVKNSNASELEKIRLFVHTYNEIVLEQNKTKELTKRIEKIKENRNKSQSELRSTYKNIIKGETYGN
ncbi:hypothetical protein [Gluconobacter cerinus]|uniref:hypothetical protein n=1 Tax=Gluconobacter cerinus TaxID=38307 RepID=UPI001B8D4570|nr:hypothetical protein [Gluconobacter cerinus]MBS0984325.1 hypothetical protein [Gluconobacter cerinus]